MVVCMFSHKVRKKKQDGSVSVALLEVFAGRFVCLGESDVNMRVIQEAGSEARERGGREVILLKSVVILVEAQFQTLH